MLQTIPACIHEDGRLIQPRHLNAIAIKIKNDRADKHVVFVEPAHFLLALNAFGIGTVIVYANTSGDIGMTALNFEVVALPFVTKF
ncbi:hypothetical protein PsAD2_03210 [Pseudovibrio axinellae]|uniref:Uncharacterized protein n=1 Tax=Pseudovibrio axinellae TaxID=989403 RepID=A0A165X0B7_9HYPH|nr:hypothetical protein PsAD2_03210 [Pseudovibrio axinellae]